MAVGAIFGGPMLNLLLGLGVALSFSPKRFDGGRFNICFGLKPDPTVTVTFLFLMFSLLVSGIIVPVCGFNLVRWKKICMFGCSV